ncbi:hypothetical protein LCGC14_0694230 [marine sediment metagenome]|uniref:Uncharacterized protein n=1 Tax=marine sediment metagenome TaxID=412755 RepID=A0A0F9T5V9_9ZZZZ
MFQVVFEWWLSLKEEERFEIIENAFCNNKELKMPFAITRECKCCRDLLWHCKKCWDKFHNGRLHKDYEPPKHYGQSMFDGEFTKKMKEFGIIFIPKIKEDKKRDYKEGEYH